MGKLFNSLPLLAGILLLAALTAAPARSPSGGAALVTPDWCRKLPRPEYSHLRRVPVHNSLFLAHCSEAAPCGNEDLQFPQ